MIAAFETAGGTGENNFGHPCSFVILEWAAAVWTRETPPAAYPVHTV
jgi:hypothetical protein